MGMWSGFRYVGVKDRFDRRLHIGTPANEEPIDGSKGFTLPRLVPVLFR